MKGLVLDLITSYENRISTVEDLVTNTYQASIAAEGSFSDIDAEREELKTSLQKTLAKNCSLRRKDFNRLMEGVLTDYQRKRGEIEEERKRLIAKVQGYLQEQKELATSLKQQLVQLAPEKVANGGLDTVIDNIKRTYQDTAQQLFALLCDLQSHLEAFRKEQEEINHRLKRLADRGESLRIEDLRQLEAAKSCQDRKAERKLRRQEVGRLLAHFKQYREGDRQWRQ